jgi:hypothetical protein
MNAHSSPMMLSYAREDAEFALHLAKSLRQAGAVIWIDQLDIRPGQRWDEAIEAELRACRGLIVVLSPASVGSHNVMDEVSYALEVGKEVIPILHRTCDVPFRLRRLQYIDFTAQYEPAVALLRDTMAAATSEAAPGQKPGPGERSPQKQPAEPHATGWRPLSWGRTLLGAMGGALVGGYVGSAMVALPWKSHGANSVNWAAFDYGNPVVLMVVTVAIAGAICATNVRAILFALTGLGIGFLLFTFLNANLFIVEEGIVLLPIGALIGATIGRWRALTKRTRNGFGV